MTGKPLGRGLELRGEVRIWGGGYRWGRRHIYEVHGRAVEKGALGEGPSPTPTCGSRLEQGQPAKG